METGSSQEKQLGRSTLRKRNHGGAHRQSVTQLPLQDQKGVSVVDITPIPKRKMIKGSSAGAPSSEMNDNSSYNSPSGSTRVGGPKQELMSASLIPSNDGPRGEMSAEQVRKDEGRWRKFLIRGVSGMVLIHSFMFLLYAGHIYICFLVLLLQTLLFRELVRVRYSTYFKTVKDTIPLFRTTQWVWFLVSIVYTYGDFAAEVIKDNQDLHQFLWFAQYSWFISFFCYSSAFVLTVATMQVGHIKFQVNQLCWTIVVLCLTVGQLKYIMHNIYNGIFWFAFPILLVVTNDVAAYFSGVTCGRKFIQRSFISFSPNKTWEGFIGGGIITVIWSWYLSRFMSKYKWLTCPVDSFRLWHHELDCEVDPVFLEAQHYFPSQIFEVFPRVLVKMIPLKGLREMCSVLNTDGPLITPCISGDESHVHHHFDLVLKGFSPIQIHGLSLAVFASVVAPFGGFLASAIKRAYAIKDFDSIIPGHGGVMDRVDCQFLMALFTWVHYNTFIKMATVSVPKMVYMYNLLSDQEKAEFFWQMYNSWSEEEKAELFAGQLE